MAASILPSLAMASGYKLNEQSAAGMGTAHAGRAAMAEDASVVFYNPAAMTELDRAQLTAGFTYINGNGEFDGKATNVGGFDITGADDTDPYSNGGNYLGESFIPFFYYARPINEKMSVGLGIFTPFGTKTNYEDDFVGGGFADETSLISMEIAPTFAYKVNDKLSIGGGLDIVYMEGLLSKFVDAVPYSAAADAGYKATYAGNIAAGATDAQATAAAEAAVNGLTADSPILDSANAGFENHYEVKGDDWGVGWNFGAYYQLTEATTLGFTYRSEIEFELEGDSKFDREFKYYDKTSGSVNSFGNIRPQASKVPLTTPASATLAVTHQYNDELLLQAGATWTGWSSFKSFDVIATENTDPMVPHPADPTKVVPSDGVIDISDVSQINGLKDGYIGHIDERWVDVWAVAFGGTYQLNDKLALRAGYAYDQSPVRDEFRTARVPSSDRQWVTLGAGYTVNQDLSFDVAAGYLFMYPMDLSEKNKNLDNQEIGDASVTGEYEIDVFGLSAQVNYKF
ncbi:OmpP1/FadL family transporter [Pseudomonas sp. HK3]